MLLDALTVIQNLAMPFTLDDRAAAGRHPRARRGAGARGRASPRRRWTVRSATSTPATLRVRLGRALALDPAVLLLEHPTRRASARATSRPIRRIRVIAVCRAAAHRADRRRRVRRGGGGPRPDLEPATGRLHERCRLVFCGRGGGDVARSAMRTRSPPKENRYEYATVYLRAMLIARRRRHAPPASDTASRVCSSSSRRTNATVKSPVHLKFGIENYQIAAVPAGTVDHRAAGHRALSRRRR